MDSSGFEPKTKISITSNVQTLSRTNGYSALTDYATEDFMNELVFKFLLDVYLPCNCNTGCPKALPKAFVYTLNLNEYVKNQAPYLLFFRKVF